MSNQFYKYLSEKISKYFKDNTPGSGEKYCIELKTDEQVDSLYSELKNNIFAQEFIYEDLELNQKYETYELNYGQTQLIVAASINKHPHEHFLANLRNLVGQVEGYENKAILFIYCADIDTLTGGGGSLDKEGMPLNITSIEQDIKRKISENGYSLIDKTILEMYLSGKRRDLDTSDYSMFEYEDIICCLSDSQILLEQYRTFELFPDQQLYMYDGNSKEVKKRLERNHEAFVSVAENHTMGLDQAKLEKNFGDAGARELSKSDSWYKTEYSEVEKFIYSKNNKVSIEYIPLISDYKIWDSEEGPSKVKSRTRNIIVFQDEYSETKSIVLGFTEYLKNNCVEVAPAYKSLIEYATKGKKLEITLSGIQEDRTSFYRVYYNAEDARFDFKIAVINCDSKLLEKYKAQYSIELKNDYKAIRIKTEDDEVIFNETAENIIEKKVQEDNQIIVINNGEGVSVSISDEYLEENDDVHFEISTEKTVIPIIKSFVIEKPVVIDGQKLWYLKRKNKTNFDVLSENTLLFGTKKYFTRDEFKKMLEREKKYIAIGEPFVSEDINGELIPQKLCLPENIREAFNAIIDFFKEHNSSPSLFYINTELENLYKTYLDSIIDSIARIQKDDYLAKDHNDHLFYLGMVVKDCGDKEIFLSPLHPMNIAYQLYINEQNIDGLNEGDGDLLSKFQSAPLLPYITQNPLTKERCVYVPVEQVHSPEWKVYIDETLPRYKGSKDFVSKLVSSKISEFIKHFSYLFDNDSKINSPLKINLINTGDCREIVHGIIKYYARVLSDARTKTITPIQVTMYSDYHMDNAFELVSRTDNLSIILDYLHMELRELRNDTLSPEEIIDIYRKNVKFYNKKTTDEFTYSHVAFMELDDDIESTKSIMSDIPTGVAMGGISSGVSSEMLGGSYRTGFGTKYLSAESNLITLAKRYNALNAALNGDAYNEDYCFAMQMSMNKQKTLDRIYDASNWVVFIDPKVDLSYFKEDLSSKELMIIHYSDQYNLASSGYDAITVTKKSAQYQNAISKYLTKNGVDNATESSRKIISIFNALNGDWLLRMLSSESHFPVEKLSILSAMKYAVKKFSSENIIWIPVSLEEILRVSGSVGLSKNNSSFSAKNLGFDGSCSDDLLLIGIKDGEKIEITYYPIEVKIGKVEDGYLQKGITQVRTTRNIFDEILGTGSSKDKSIKTRFYRNFFVQQMLINAGKMLLYEIGTNEQGWDKIVSSELRSKLLNEEYEIVDCLVPGMGKSAVISFREECKKERVFRNQDVLIVEKTKKEGVNLLATDFSNIESIDWSSVEDFDINEVVADNSVETNTENTEAASEMVDDNKPEDIIPPTPTDSNAQNTVIEKNLSNARVLIGKDKYSHEVYWEFGNKNLANRHMLITGTSGYGKTYTIQTMLYELSQYNVSSVVFDYTDGFMVHQLEQQFRDSLGDKIDQKIIYSTGVPINPFKRHEVELAGTKILEKAADVAARLADIFVHVYDFGPQQYSAIFDAALNGINKYGDSMTMNLFRTELEDVAESNSSAGTVLSKLSPFFHTVDFVNDPSFNWNDVLYTDDAKINIIQLTMFSDQLKTIITELMLWDAWYYTKKFGTKEKPFVVVLDEAQNLSHTLKSPSAAILTEGRKFGWSAWFATQSLKVLKDDEVVRLLQSAFKLYFKPADIELQKTAKQLDATGKENWLSELQKLKKGQCIVVGDRMRGDGIVGPSAPTVTNIASFDERLE